MTLKVSCSCGAKFTAQDKLAGKQVTCPKCGGQLSVPAQGAARQPIHVTCQCGKSFGAKPELAGRQVKCPNCANPLQIPSSSIPELPPLTEPTSPWDLPADASQATGLEDMPFPGPASPQFGGSELGGPVPFAPTGFAGGHQPQMMTKPVAAQQKKSKLGGGINALKTGFLITAAIVVAIVRMVSCNSEPDNQSFAMNTPEGVFEDFREAIIAEDWTKAASMFTLEESQAQSAGYLTMLALFAGDDSGAAAILEKHGFDPQDVVRQLNPTQSGSSEHTKSLVQLVRRIRSHSAFVADCWSWQYARDGERPYAFMIDAELSDLRLNDRNAFTADRATATVKTHIAGQAREFQWVFLRPKNYRPNYWQIAGKND